MVIARYNPAEGYTITLEGAIEFIQLESGHFLNSSLDGKTLNFVLGDTKNQDGLDLRKKPKSIDVIMDYKIFQEAKRRGTYIMRHPSEGPVTVICD